MSHILTVFMIWKGMINIMMENKEINMKKEHYEKLDEIDLKMERLITLQRLLGKRVFGKYCDKSLDNDGFDEIDKEENAEICALSDQLEDNMKEIRKSIKSILNDAGVI